MAAAAEHIGRHQQAKVVMVSSKRGPAMAVLPADHKLDLRKLKKIIHEPVTLQSEAEFAPVFADCETGAIPPLAICMGYPPTSTSTSRRRITSYLKRGLIPTRSKSAIVIMSAP
jgi:prolyl-tRNA editing enzyme YbaK/EbsC (Cys-tRNA(Pro) deacylase)